MGLDYDDSAFAYFGLTLLTIFAIPYTYYYLTSTFQRETSEATGIDQLSSIEIKDLVRRSRPGYDIPRCENEKLQTDKMIENQPVGDFISTLNMKQIVKTIIFLLLWSSIAKLALVTSQDDIEISQFDPYSVLDIPRDSTEQQIRKKYRRLSVEWHPDQWVSKGAEEQAKAEAMFIKISKAYAALTDEVSRENYRKYGNPDGPQPMELSLGLPSFLLEKRNHNVVLLIYIVVLVVVIPTAVFLYYSNSKKYSDKQILNETYQVLAYLLNPNIATKHLIEVLSLSAEFRRIVKREQNVDELFEKLQKFLVSKGFFPKHPTPQATNLFAKWPGNEKAYIILLAHFHRVIPPTLSDTSRSYAIYDGADSSFTNSEISFLRQTMDDVLQKCPMLLDAMIEVSNMRRSLKLLHKVTAFRACVLQAIHPGSPNGLLMLPEAEKHDALIAKLSSKGITTVDQFYRLVTQSSYNGKIQGVTVAPEFVELCKKIIYTSGIVLPEVTIKIGCLDHEDKMTGRVFLDKKFGEQDIVTVYVVLNYTGSPLEENTDADPSNVDKDLSEKNDPFDFVAYSPRFPSFFRESFNISVGISNSDEHLLSSMDAIVDRKIIRKKLMFKPDFKKPGKYNFNVFVKSKVYVGLEMKQNVELEVLKQEDIEQPQVHPEDLETEKTPGIFDVFENAEVEEDSDFEDEKKPEEASK